MEEKSKQHNSEKRPSNADIAARLRGTNGLCAVRAEDGRWYSVERPKHKVTRFSDLLDELKA